MARTYTNLLGSVSGAANESAELFTAEPGYVYVVRDVLFVSLDGAESILNLYRSTGGTARQLLYVTVPPLGTYHLDLRQVIPVSSSLSVFSSSTDWYVSVTGYQLVADS
jgi:hypothetical protein